MPNGSYQRLYAVPKNEIFAVLRIRMGDEGVISALEQIRGIAVSLEDVRRASHNEFIRIAEASENFGEDDVVFLNEEFRYRGTKTLYIHSYPENEIELISEALRSGEIDGLNNILRRVINEQDELGQGSKFSELRIRDTENFNVNGENLFELVYSYVAQVKTTDPVTEESVLYPDIRYGFIWANTATSWIVISAKDMAIVNALSEALQRYFGVSISRLPIPKTAEIAVKSYEQMRRASHVDGRGIRHRVSHQELHTFPEEIEEIQQRDQSEARSSSGYNADFEGTQFAINYSREKGAISFSKLLPTSQLRVFGVGEITPIYQTVQNLRLNAPQELVSLLIPTVLSGSLSTTKEGVEEVISKLASARQANLDEIRLDVSPVDLAKLPKYFTLRSAVQCDACDDLQEVRCQYCEGERFVISNDQLQCRNCNTPLDQGDVWCVEGHQSYLGSSLEAITLYPTKSMFGVVEQTLSLASQAAFNRWEEGFFIRENTLNLFGQHGQKTIYLLEDIPEFQPPASIVLSSEQEEVFTLLLKDYREKCGHMSNEACSQCVENRGSSHCQMRLFGLYDARYTPRPHRGGEFGDVSLGITIDGHPDRILVILLKKGDPRGRPITKSHSAGTGIHIQIQDFLHDPRVQMIGIGIPQRLEDGFVAQLQHLASRNEKKLTFFGPREFSKIIRFVLERDGLSIEEL